jgi:hypothetical protein
MNWDQFHTTNSPQMLHAWMLLPVAPEAGVPPWTGKWPIEIVDLPNSRMVIVHRQCKRLPEGKQLQFATLTQDENSLNCLNLHEFNLEFMFKGFSHCNPVTGVFLC